MTLPQSFHDRKVCVIGLGYVGLTLAVAMADTGFSVLGIEIREDVLDKLRKGQPHFFEPRLKEKLSRVMASGALQVVRDIDASFAPTVFIITVGTPLNKKGEIELSFIKRATGQVAAVLKEGDLVILRSTVKIGTARNIVMPILAETGKSFELAVCPERTLEGRALLELHSLPQIIGSDQTDTRFRCSQLFSVMTPTTVSVSSLESAELVKLVDNTYRDVSFAFANEIAKLAAPLGVSAREVIAAGTLGYPRTNVAWPGPVGGPCLEKDPHILAASAEEHGVDMAITKAARLTNQQQPSNVSDLIAALSRTQNGFSSSPRICIMGLAFKGLPETDDLRGTMALPILHALRARFPAATFVGYDPVVPIPDAEAFFGIEIIATIEQAFRDADIVVIANNHAALRNMELPTLAESMNRPSIVYDFWNMFDDTAASMPADVQYVGLGSENISPVLWKNPNPPSQARASAKAKRYLVTGGTGFIGSFLVRRLIADGHSVKLIDNDLRGNAGRLSDLTGHFDLVACDVRDTQAVTEASRGADAILHLAALNGTENFYKRPELVLDIGIRGMQAVLEAAKANGIPEVVLASSSEAYQSPPMVPTPEDVPLMIPDPWNPRYSYGGSKIISEILLSCCNTSAIERAMIFRPHNVYGPDMGYEHVLPQLVMRAATQIKKHPSGTIPFEIQGDGSQTRSFVYISDFVDGLMLILDKGEHRNVYHVGTEDEVTIRELVAHIFKFLGRDFTLVPSPLPAGGTMRRCPSIAKLQGLGYTPKVDLSDGIAALARWYIDEQNARPVSRAEVPA